MKKKKGIFAALFGSRSGCCCSMEIEEEPKEGKGGCCDMQIVPEDDTSDPEEKADS